MMLGGLSHSVPAPYRIPKLFSTQELNTHGRVENSSVTKLGTHGIHNHFILSYSLRAWLIDKLFHWGPDLNPHSGFFRMGCEMKPVSTSILELDTLFLFSHGVDTNQKDFTLE